MHGGVCCKHAGAVKLACMRSFFLSVGVAVLVVLMTACGSSMPDVSHPVKGWGETHTGPQVHVSAREPVNFDTSAESVYPPSGSDAWRTTLVVRNNSQRPFSVGWLRTEAHANGQKQKEVVDPVEGCNGLATATTVLPGETRGVNVCWEGDDDRSVTVTHPGALGAITFAD